MQLLTLDNIEDGIVQVLVVEVDMESSAASPVGQPHQHPDKVVAGHTDIVRCILDTGIVTAVVEQEEVQEDRYSSCSYVETGSEVDRGTYIWLELPSASFSSCQLR